MLPLMLPCRNLTITGADGLNTVLDWQFLYTTKLHLCGTCTLAFENITIANDQRDAGAGIDAVQGQPGSRLTMHNVYMIKLACTSDQAMLAVISTTPRSTMFSGSQQFALTNVTFQVGALVQPISGLDCDGAAAALIDG